MLVLGIETIMSCRQFIVPLGTAMLQDLQKCRLIYAMFLLLLASLFALACVHSAGGK